MIRRDELVEIGRFLKTHGINGEIVFAPLYDLDLADLRCVVVHIDGLPVPFFVEKVRPKGENLIVKIADINNEKEAALLTHKDVFAMADDVEITDDNGDDGFSAYQFKGFSVVDADSGRTLGTIDYIDDSTPNWLFMVDTGDHNMLAIPVADEFVNDIDTEKRILTMSLPQGLLEL